MLLPLGGVLRRLLERSVRFAGCRCCLSLPLLERGVRFGVGTWCRCRRAVCALELGCFGMLPTNFRCCLRSLLVLFFVIVVLMILCPLQVRDVNKSFH